MRAHRATRWRRLVSWRGWLVVLFLGLLANTVMWLSGVDKSWLYLVSTVVVLVAAASMLVSRAAPHDPLSEQ
jgi:hypothetical protein